MKRGDVIRIAGSGDFAGKPRPAVIVQADAFCDEHATLTVVPLTSRSKHSVAFRISVAASKENGLIKDSDAQIDKVQAVRRDRTRDSIGALDLWSMQRIDQALRDWLSL